MPELPDLTALRSAVRGLAEAIDDLRQQSGDTPEVRRLAVDAARIAEDVDAMPGAAPTTTPAPDQSIGIPDGDYPPEFWADAADEGVGRQ